jgi:hypothetical protein
MTRFRGRYVVEEWVWRPLRKKDGTLSRIFGTEEKQPAYTPLFTCELCGKISTPKNVYYRVDIYCWNWTHDKDFGTKSISTLCQGCYNKVKAIVRKEKQANECKRLMRKVQEIISNERKNPNDRRTKGLSCVHDDSSPEREH